MNEHKNDVVKMWFKKGDSDLKNVENNLASKDIPLDTICSHSQQAIEKYFKGALVYFEKDISKTHDLVKLLTEVVSFIPELSELEEPLEKISEFAVEVRYPDSFYEPTLEDAKESYKFALKIREIILNRIKIE